MTAAPEPDRTPEARAGEARLALYTAAARAAAERVIGAYSTSFGLAARVLPRRCRAGIRDVYALVRVADEVVDGVAAEAGLTPEQQRRALDALAAETRAAMASGFSTDLVVHAFAQTARASGITWDIVEPFFASMAMDLTPRALDLTEQRRYVYGSAEVVGLMCARVFLAAAESRQGPDGAASSADRLAIERGACALGAAFQNVNFLRDLADDADRLGRGYLPDLETGEAASGPLSERAKRAWVAQIRADLDTADAAIALLPPDVRPSVRAAWSLFAELNQRIARTPAAALATTRIRVPDSVKLVLVARAIARERSRAWRASR